MDTPNINGAKTTTLPATLGGGWYTQLTERTKRSRHSWSMIPFTEPTYSVPDGNSRKVGEADIPTIFSLQTAPNAGNGSQPDSLRAAINTLAQALQEAGNDPRRRRNAYRNFKTRASFLQEELVRYIATGTSIGHLENEFLENDVGPEILADFGPGEPLDTHEWMATVMQSVSEVRFNEWGAGGPVAWLYALIEAGQDLDTAFPIDMNDLAAAFSGKRLKAPVLVHYMNDPRIFLNPLAQANAVGEGFVPEMDIAAMTGAGLQIVYAMNIDDASAMISSDPFGNTIAVYAHNRDCHVLVHPSLYNQYGYRLRRILQDLGPLRPSVSHIGLGHLVQQGNQTNVVSPSLGWSVGQLYYNGNNYRADGSCYIPGDYHPYSLLKRTAKFNHIVTQVGSAWLGSFGAYGCGNEEGFMPRRGLNNTIAPMVQLLWGEQFGYTTSPSIPTEPFFDPETVAQRMDEHLISTFGSGILAFDAGQGLGPALEFLNAVVENSNGGEDVQFFTSLWLGSGDFRNNVYGAWGLNLGLSRDDIDTALVAITELNDFGISRAIEHVWSAVKAAIGPLFQVPLTPMTLLHSGGPRPGHVVERLQMNFRPDMAVSGGTAGTKPYFLMPTQLNPGETLIRLPTFLNMTVEAARDQVNTWLGPRDPTVLTGVETIHYDGDRPREMSDPDYALESPIIIRDASVGTLEKNGRPVTIHRLPRPAYHREGASFVGVFNTLTHGIESANGNYYLYPVFEGAEDMDTLHYEPGRGGLVMTGVAQVSTASFGGADGAGAVEVANVTREHVGRNGRFTFNNIMNEQQAGLQPAANGQSIGFGPTGGDTHVEGQEIPAFATPNTADVLDEDYLALVDEIERLEDQNDALRFAAAGEGADEVGDAA